LNGLGAPAGLLARNMKRGAALPIIKGMSQRYATFREFYPFYLNEHRDPTCRRLHFVGSALIVVLVALVIARLLAPWWLLAVPLVGYGFAWVGHFFFERNRPATFTYPLYSLIGDWVMFKDILTGRIRF
jgi:hypothetical protein